jgi:ATP-dependent Clp protease, protease subunit
VLCAWRMSVAGKLPDPPNRRQLSAWLQERLFERRIVLVTGRLDADLAAEATAALITLDRINDEPIDLHLDSADGTLESAFALIDTADLLRATAAPHTRFRLFQPTTQFSGPPDQITSYSRAQQELLWRLHARLAHLTRRPAEEIAEDIRRGRYLDATEALAYGLIDEIRGTR